MYYFGYCTWLHGAELHRYFPDCEIVTKGYAANHKLEFRSAGARRDRGWCHLADTHDAWGTKTLGIVVKHPEKHFGEDYDDFERCFLTIRGDDGKAYDCWTYRLSQPGEPMRPPNFYWQHIPDGMAELGFPKDYVDSVLATFHAAAECPRADRPNPSAIPGKSAASR